mmetsp:Transcript_17068/g.37025  ORF Transcript_17068/g.37025 Transcript_17068/m.37025 type:complete len:98 (+) Transcript_17068:8-301(+)
MQQTIRYHGVITGCNTKSYKSKPIIEHDNTIAYKMRGHPVEHVGTVDLLLITGKPMKRLGGYVVMLFDRSELVKGDWAEGKRSRRASATVGFPRWQK